MLEKFELSTTKWFGGWEHPSEESSERSHAAIAWFFLEKRMERDPECGVPDVGIRTLEKYSNLAKQDEYDGLKLFCSVSIDPGKIVGRNGKWSYAPPFIEQSDQICSFSRKKPVVLASPCKVWPMLWFLGEAREARLDWNVWF
jgi:hypothetical protein